MTTIAKLALLLMLLAAPAAAICGEYTFCNNELDYYVPQNLLDWAKRVEEERMFGFMRKLGCWTDGDNVTGRVVCEADGVEVAYEWKRQDDYRPESVLIMVPADGVRDDAVAD